MIAIVIPYYKIYFLRQLLTSLKNQTDQRFNVYIGNDNSPDDPEEIINQYRDSLNITYKKFDNNLGGNALTEQWDRCLNLIGDEEWFMMPGDDDTYDSNVVEKFYANRHIIDKKIIHVVKYATLLIDEKDNVISRKYTHPQFEKATDALFRILLGNSRSSLCEYIFKTSQYKKYKFKPYPLAWGADYMATLEFSNFGQIYTINDAVAYFRYSDYNISGKPHKDVFKKKLAFYLLFKDLLLQHSFNFSSRQKCDIIKFVVRYGVSTFKMGIKDRIILNTSILFAFIRDLKGK